MKDTAINWQLILNIVQFALSIVLGLYLWISNKSKVTNSRIDNLESDVDQRMDDLSGRMIKVESAIEHTPSPEQIDKIYKRLGTLQASSAYTKGEIKGMNKTLDLIHQSLLEKDK